MIHTQWSCRHGDTARTSIWAVLADDGEPIDLTQWTVRAQLRPSHTSPRVDYSFTVGDGITVGSAFVQWNGTVVSTSTVQLYLDPADWVTVPRPYSGVLDVEMASDTSSTPQQVYTLVEAVFDAAADVTRVSI